jgi:hypothetical protein
MEKRCRETGDASNVGNASSTPPSSTDCGLADYEVQGQTVAETLLDLKDDNTIRGRDPHGKFRSLYIQLSRIKFLHRLHL